MKIIKNSEVKYSINYGYLLKLWNLDIKKNIKDLLKNNVKYSFASSNYRIKILTTQKINIKIDNIIIDSILPTHEILEYKLYMLYIPNDSVLEFLNMDGIILINKDEIE